MNDINDLIKSINNFVEYQPKLEDLTQIYDSVSDKDMVNTVWQAVEKEKLIRLQNEMNVKIKDLDEL